MGYLASDYGQFPLLTSSLLLPSRHANAMGDAPRDALPFHPQAQSAMTGSKSQPQQQLSQPSQQQKSSAASAQATSAATAVEPLEAVRALEKLRQRGASSYEGQPACDHCRRRKIRCDRVQPTCGTCARLGRVCQTNDLLMRRGPPSNKERAAYQAAGLEIPSLKYRHRTRRAQGLPEKRPSKSGSSKSRPSDASTVGDTSTTQQYNASIDGMPAMASGSHSPVEQSSRRVSLSDQSTEWSPIFGPDVRTRSYTFDESVTDQAPAWLAHLHSATRGLQIASTAAAAQSSLASAVPTQPLAMQGPARITPMPVLEHFSMPLRSAPPALAGPRGMFDAAGPTGGNGAFFPDPEFMRRAATYDQEIGPDQQYPPADYMLPPAAQIVFDQPRANADAGPSTAPLYPPGQSFGPSVMRPWAPSGLTDSSDRPLRPYDMYPMRPQHDAAFDGVQSEPAWAREPARPGSSAGVHAPGNPMYSPIQQRPSTSGEGSFGGSFGYAAAGPALQPLQPSHYSYPPDMPPAPRQQHDRAQQQQQPGAPPSHLSQPQYPPQ